MDAQRVRDAIAEARGNLSDALRSVSVPRPDAVRCWSELFEAEASIEEAMNELRVEFRKVSEHGAR